VTAVNRIVLCVHYKHVRSGLKTGPISDSRFDHDDTDDESGIRSEIHDVDLYWDRPWVLGQNVQNKNA
jgi:hypothetical protein